MPPYTFMEKEDRPFVKDMDTWELYRMDGPTKDKWFRIDSSDSRVRIESQASSISEFEAKKLAWELEQECEIDRREGGR